MTPELLSAALGVSLEKAQTWAQPIADACAERHINTRPRLAAFLAQVGHESGLFTELVENLNYSAEGLLKIFPKHFTAAEAQHYAHHPSWIGSRVYADRMGNGNEASWDGYTYRGRGLIQLTGRDNYRACGLGLQVDLEGMPALLEQPGHAARSAAWFWDHHGLNALADAGDFKAITHCINGGLIGLEEREALLARVTKALAPTASTGA
jgi:putative chitinase